MDIARADCRQCGHIHQRKWRERLVHARPHPLSKPLSCLGASRYSRKSSGPSMASPNSASADDSWWRFSTIAHLAPRPPKPSRLTTASKSSGRRYSLKVTDDHRNPRAYKTSPSWRHQRSSRSSQRSHSIIAVCIQWLQLLDRSDYLKLPERGAGCDQVATTVLPDRHFHIDSSNQNTFFKNYRFVL